MGGLKAFKRMPANRQNANVKRAAEMALRSVGGNTSKLTPGHINHVAQMMNVPPSEIAARLKERGISL